MEKQSYETKDIHEHIHDIKSSLQFLVVANEMVMEDEALDGKHKALLATMMGEINKIDEVVGAIEKQFGGTSYDT